ncbi:MAG: hypothetical protein H7196_04235 [candidate division SR1 bacterium]|nr:hypothetical protein [candidate division SR1 bacterium]
MPAPRNYKQNLTSGLKKSLIHSITSKQTVKKGLTFGRKHPLIAIFIIITLILAGW